MFVRPGEALALGSGITNYSIGAAPIRSLDFDRHVIGRIFLHASVEAFHLGESIPDRIGVDSDSFWRLVDYLRLGNFVVGGGERKRVPDDEELMVRQLLNQSRSDDGLIGDWLSFMIARRALEANHLWEDLGLAERSDLSLLLGRHFAGLAGKNTRNMRWKKFLYRALCEAEGFTMCPSPTCDSCSEFSVCYSDESGASALVRANRNDESGA